MSVHKLSSLFLVVIYPWLMLTFVVPFLGKVVHNITGSQIYGYLTVALFFIVFLVSWYKLAEKVIAYNISKFWSVEKRKIMEETKTT